MEITEQKKSEIIEEVQDAVSMFEGIDFDEYVDSCKYLTEEEKEWAREHLGVALIVEER